MNGYISTSNQNQDLENRYRDAAKFSILPLRGKELLQIRQLRVEGIPIMFTPFSPHLIE